MTHSDDLLEPHEAELHDLLERTMRGAPIPAELGLHALRQGRRLRARRRVGIAAGAVAASAAAALILPAALGGGLPTALRPAGEASSSATAPSPSTSALTPAPAPKGWWDMPATDMVMAVEAILPGGVSVTSPGPLEATAEGGPATGYIAPRLSGPSGAGQLTLILAHHLYFFRMESSPRAVGDDALEPGTTMPGRNDIACPENLSSRAQCAELYAADGALIGRRLSEVTGDVTRLEVVLRRNGGTIYGASTNTFDDTGVPAARPLAETPPLTLDQLEDLVRNDTWVMPAT